MILKNCLVNGNLADIGIKGPEIDYVGKIRGRGAEVIDLRGMKVIPGLIDPHVHVRDLEQAAKEDWCSVSQAAFRGGVTTIFDMPNSIPPTSDLKGLELKRAAAEKAGVDFKLYLGATGSNLSDLDEILAAKPEDVCGIKVFLASSSSNELIEEPEALQKLFEMARKFDVIVAVHTELQACLERWKNEFPGSIENHNHLRNRQCAIEGTRKVLEIAERVGNRLYLTHVSTAEEIELIRVYKNSCDVICEVTPHHLLLDESVLKESGNFGKVNPPLRTIRDNEALWKAVTDGVVDLIGSDHAPHLISEKEMDYEGAPSGFPGLETTLPVLMQAVKTGKLSLPRFVELTSGNPARIFRLGSKGQIKKDFKADLVIINENIQGKILPSEFRSKAKYSPFAGYPVQSAVEMTLLSGEIVYRRDK